MEVIVDRFEKDYAIVEIDLDKFAIISKDLIPKAVEGDIIKITIDKSKSAKREAKISRLMNNLFKD